VIEHAVGVVEYKLTGSPELAVAMRGMVEAAVWAGITANAMVCCFLFLRAVNSGSLVACAIETAQSVAMREIAVTVG
jgi:hypothetical protein